VSSHDYRSLEAIKTTAMVVWRQAKVRVCGLWLRSRLNARPVCVAQRCRAVCSAIRAERLNFWVVKTRRKRCVIVNAFDIVSSYCFSLRWRKKNCRFPHIESVPSYDIHNYVLVDSVGLGSLVMWVGSDQVVKFTPFPALIWIACWNSNIWTISNE